MALLIPKPKKKRKSVVVFNPSDILNYFIGVDPGKGGAIAFLNRNGDLLHAEDCPPDLSKIPDIVKAGLRIFKFYGPVYPAIGVEEVGGMPGEGVKSISTFSRNHGVWLGACWSIEDAIVFRVSPQEWQGAYEMLPVWIKNKPVGAPKEKRKLKKIRTLETTELVFRHNKVDVSLKTPRGRILDGRCDAALIANYVRFKYHCTP